MIQNETAAKDATSAAALDGETSCGHIGHLDLRTGARAVLTLLAYAVVAYCLFGIPD